MYKLVLLLFTMSVSVQATLYSDERLSTLFNDDTLVFDQREFTRQFFTATDPQFFITQSLANSRNASQKIILEYNIFGLLDQIATMPKQSYLERFVQKMQSYEVGSYKMHEEGNLPVPVFNIPSRAKGIENIWLANDSFHYYNNQLNQQPLDVLHENLDKLKDSFSTLKEPQWLGLKKSLKNLNNESKADIDAYLFQLNNGARNLDKFISHYALITQNQEMVAHFLPVLDKSNGQYLLRKISEYFDREFVIEQLLLSATNDIHTAFAISMMIPYLDNDNNIKTYLFKTLKQAQYASNAAFALSNSKNVAVLNQLEQNYYNTENSGEKTQIIFAIQMNSMPESNEIIDRLITTMASDSPALQWLNSFEKSQSAGERL